MREMKIFNGFSEPCQEVPTSLCWIGLFVLCLLFMPIKIQIAEEGARGYNPG